MSLLLSHECASAQNAQQILIRRTEHDKTLRYIGPPDSYSDVKLIFLQYDKIH